MPQKAVYLETFGCQMNELDSELVAGSLRALGYRFVPDAKDADVVLYNTCSVREHAEQKVWSRLGELSQRKIADPSLIVGVLGCMAERDGVDLIRRMPVVDVMCGPGELDKLPSLLDNAVRTRQSLLDEACCEGSDDAWNATSNSTAMRDGKPVASISAKAVALQGNSSRRSATLAAAGDTLELLDLSRAISPADSDGTAPKSAYVRITRGCNKFCTYCVVPFTRGAEVHRPPQHIIDECKRLADSGVIEITLLGQTVNHYRFEHDAAISVDGLLQPQKGRSYAARNGDGEHRRDPFEGERVTTFANLLSRIHDEVPAIQRLRFVTSYPRDFGDDVLEAIRDHPRICRYLHVPAQTGSDRLLKLMNRGYTVAEYLEFLDRARAILHQPEIGRPLMVSGDFIVGFPTETEEDFAQSMELVRRARYKNAFIFKYSPRPGTVAIDKFEDDISESVKRRRNNELLNLQNSICDELSREQVGTTFTVFAEGLSRRTLKKSGLTTAGIKRANAIAITVGGRSIDPSQSSSATTSLGDTSSSSTACLTVSLDNSSQEDTTPDSYNSSGEPQIVQLACRTDGDLIVFIECAPDLARSLVGSMTRVKVVRAEGLALHGILVNPTSDL